MLAGTKGSRLTCPPDPQIRVCLATQGRSYWFSLKWCLWPIPPLFSWWRLMGKNAGPGPSTQHLWLILTKCCKPLKARDPAPLIYIYTFVWYDCSPHSGCWAVKMRSEKLLIVRELLKVCRAIGSEPEILPPNTSAAPHFILRLNIHKWKAETWNMKYWNKINTNITCNKL